MSSSSSPPSSGFDCSQKSYLGEFQINETPEQLTFATPLTPDSSSSHAIDRKSPPRDPPPERTSRPRNQFIIFRSKFIEANKVVLGQKDNRHISQIAGEMWNLMTAEERAPFAEMAKREKLLHQQQYPDYKYCPRKRGTRKHRNTYGNTPEHKLYYKKMAAACAKVGPNRAALSDDIQAVPKVEDDRPKRTRKSKPKVNTAPATSTSRKAHAIRDARAASAETTSSDATTSAWSPATSEEFAFDTPLSPPTTHVAEHVNQPVHYEMLAEQSPPFYENYNNYSTNGKGYPFPAADYPSVDGAYPSTATQLFDAQVEHIDATQNCGEPIDVYQNYDPSNFGLSAYEMHNYSGPLSPEPSSLSVMPLYDYTSALWDAAWPAPY